MPKKKVKAQDEPVVETETTPIEAPIEAIQEIVETVQPSKGVYECVRGEEVIRVFTNETHGINAESLARQFASKFGYQVK